MTSSQVRNAPHDVTDRDNAQKDSQLLEGLTHMHVEKQIHRQTADVCATEHLKKDFA